MTNQLGHSIQQWYLIARENRLYRYCYQSANVDDLQLRVDREGNIVIVLIQLNERLRGQGRFARFVSALQQIAPVNIEIPQSRLAAWCERNNISIV